MKRLRFFGFIASLAVLASCSPIIDTRGHNTQSDDFSQIIKGQSSAEDVRAVLGTPSARSNFGEETWYYISSTKETVGMFAPEVTEQKVTAITFDQAGLVADITDYTKKDGKLVTLVEKETPTEGHKLTFMEQMLGNLGRFNAPNRPTSGSPIRR